MSDSRILTKALATALLLVLTSYAPCAFSAFHYTPHQPVLNQSNDWQDPNNYTAPSGVAGGQDISVQWPSNSIDLSQLQGLFSKFPNAGQFNIQFPNQVNWGVTPQAVSGFYQAYMKQAQAAGVNGKIPDLSFSSLAMTALSAAQSGQIQLPIAGLEGLDLNGNIKEQLMGKLREMRYAELNLGDSLPDWLKRVLLALYDAMLNAVDFMSDTLSATFR